MCNTAGFTIDFYSDLGNAAEVLDAFLTSDDFRTVAVNCTGMEQSTHLSDCILSENFFSDFVAIKCIGKYSFYDSSMLSKFTFDVIVK